jgi:hypothetical protein
MAGYAASATLHGAEPQFAFAGAHASGSARLDVRDLAGSADGAVIEQLELVGRPVNERLVDWLASVGESWSQLTFFLFDPESWR